MSLLSSFWSSVTDFYVLFITVLSELGPWSLQHATFNIRFASSTSSNKQKTLFNEPLLPKSTLFSAINVTWCAQYWAHSHTYRYYLSAIYVCTSNYFCFVFSFDPVRTNMTWPLPICVRSVQYSHVIFSARNWTSDCGWTSDEYNLVISVAFRRLTRRHESRRTGEDECRNSPSRRWRVRGRRRTARMREASGKRKWRCNRRTRWAAACRYCDWRTLK